MPIIDVPGGPPRAFLRTHPGRPATELLRGSTETRLCTHLRNINSSPRRSTKQKFAPDSNPASAHRFFVSRRNR